MGFLERLGKFLQTPITHGPTIITFASSKDLAELNKLKHEQWLQLPKKSEKAELE